MAAPQEDKIAEELERKLEAQETTLKAQETARTQGDLDKQPQPSPNDDAAKLTEGDLDKAGDAAQDELFSSPSKEEQQRLSGDQDQKPQDDAAKTTEENQETNTENTEHSVIKKADNRKENELEASDATAEEQADLTQNVSPDLDTELNQALKQTEETIKIVEKIQATESPSAPITEKVLEEDLPQTPAPSLL